MTAHQILSTGAAALADDVDVVEDIPPRTIRFPAFQWSGTTYDHVVLKPPTAQALDEAAKKETGIGATLHLIHMCGGMPIPACLLLRPQVVSYADRYFGRFTLPALPEAGDASQGG